MGKLSFGKRNLGHCEWKSHTEKQLNWNWDIEHLGKQQAGKWDSCKIWAGEMGFMQNLGWGNRICAKFGLGKWDLVLSVTFRTL